MDQYYIFSSPSSPSAPSCPSSGPTSPTTLPFLRSYSKLNSIAGLFPLREPLSSPTPSISPTPILAPSSTLPLISSPPPAYVMVGFDFLNQLEKRWEEGGGGVKEREEEAVGPTGGVDNDAQKVGLGGDDEEAGGLGWEEVGPGIGGGGDGGEGAGVVFYGVLCFEDVL